MEYATVLNCSRGIPAIGYTAAFCSMVRLAPRGTAAQRVRCERPLSHEYCIARYHYSRHGLQLNSIQQETRTQVTDTFMSISILSNQIMKTIWLYNFFRSVSDISQIGGFRRFSVCLFRFHIVTIPASHGGCTILPITSICSHQANPPVGYITG